MASTLALACSADQRAQAQQAICAQLENLSLEQMRAIFDEAEIQLASAGIKIDREVWSDPQRFQQFVNAVAKAANCPELSTAVATIQQQLHNGNSDYCGPQHELYLPTVDPCLNEACRQHDACYSQCTTDIELPCTWSDVTKPCDDVFMGVAHTCPINTHRFWSEAVIWAADKMYESSWFDSCPDGASCPKPPALGNGPCGALANEASCAACLGAYDPGRQCLGKACGGNLGDWVCYSANCDVAPCYGGWWAGSGGTGGSGGSGGTGGSGGVGGTAGVGGSGGTGGVSPTSMWNVILVGGEIPATNLGSEWDIGTPPDAVVTMHVGSASSVGYESSEATDTYAPTWNEQLATAVPAKQLMTYLSFSVEDADWDTNDFVGVCEAKLSEGHFQLATIPLKCAASSGQAGFSVNFHVEPY